MDTIKARAHTLIRKTEKYTKTDMVYLLKGSFWMNSSQIITAFIALGLSIVFANLLSPESYGTYKYILSLGGTLSAITLSGLGTVVVRAVAQGYEGEFKRAVALNFKWESVIFLAGIAGAAYYYLHGNQTLALGFLIVGIFSPPMDSAELYAAFLGGRKDFKGLSIFSIARYAIASAWLFLTILITTNPVLLALSYFFIHTMIVSFIYKRVVKTRKPNDLTHGETMRLVKHVSFMNNLSSLAAQVDNIFMFHFLGPAALAVYNFAQAIPERLTAFVKNVGALATPKFAQQDKDRVKYAIARKSIQVMLFGLVMSLIYIAIAPYFFQLFFRKYLDSVPYSQVYSLILLMPAVIPLSFLDSQVAIKEKYHLNIWSSVVKIAALYIGIAYFGIWGAIIATVASKAFGNILAFMLAARV